VADTPTPIKLRMLSPARPPPRRATATRSSGAHRCASGPPAARQPRRSHPGRRRHVDAHTTQDKGARRRDGSKGAGTHIFSSTMPFACDEPANGLAFSHVPRFLFLYFRSAHLFFLRESRSLRAQRIPRGLLRNPERTAASVQRRG